MAPASTPVSPIEDIATWKRQGAQGAGALLTPDLIAFVQSGVSVTFAAQGEGGFPVVGLGIGCRVHGDGTLRVLLSGAANARFLDAVSRGSAVAVTFTAARNHRAIQVKAQGARALPASPDDVPEMDRQCAVFRDDLIALGFPPELARGYVAHDSAQMVAIEFRPDRVFTQTPGPGAGTELTR